MNHTIATDFQGRLIDVAVAVAILLTIAAILVRTTWQPAKRIWIIQLSLLAGLILATGTCSSSRRVSLGILGAGESTKDATHASPSPRPGETDDAPPAAAYPVDAIQSAPRPAGNRAPAAGREVAKLKIKPPVVPAAPAVVAPADGKQRSINFGTLLLAAYGAIAAGMALWLAMAHWKVRLLVRRAVPVDDELAKRWQRLQDDWPTIEAPRSSRPIRLLVSDDVTYPLAAGVFRAAVLLPRWLVERHRDQLGPVLAHELAHVMRRDARSRWLAAVFQIAFFYQPVYWWLRRELRLCQEYLADARAAAMSASPVNYAEQLVELLKAAPAKPLRLQPAAGIIEGRSQLYRRVQMLVHSRRKPDFIENGRWKAAIAVGLLTIAPALGMVSLGRSRPIGTPVGEMKSAKGRSQDARNEALLLVGRVVDERGIGIPGVKVLVANSDFELLRTDENGSFRRTFKSYLHHPLIRFEKPGYSPLTVTDWTNRIATARAVHRLGRETSDNPPVVLSNKTYIEGTVRGPDGVPAPNALIHATQTERNNPECVYQDLISETRTDSAGHYKLFLEPDAYSIEIRAPGIGAVRVPEDSPFDFKHSRPVAPFEMLRANPFPRRNEMIIQSDEAKRLEIRLEPGVDFRAKIVDCVSGKPLPNIRIDNWLYPEIQGRSGPDGIVRIPTMFPGMFTFYIQTADYVRGSSSAIPERYKRAAVDPNAWNPGGPMWILTDGLLLDLQPGMPQATIFLEPGVAISGRVLDPDGKPVRGATVAPARSGSGNSLTGDSRFSVHTKSDGTFKVVLLPSDGRPYNLMVHDGQYQQWRNWANGVGSPFQATAGQRIDNVTLRLYRPGQIRGRTVDELGHPLPNAYIKARAADMLENFCYDPDTRSDSQGYFELRFLRAGRQILLGRWILPVSGRKPPIVDVRAGETTDVGNIVFSSKQPKQ